MENEICSECGAVFTPEMHWVRCGADDCPMKSKTETRSLLQMWIDGADDDGKPPRV